MTAPTVVRSNKSTANAVGSSTHTAAATPSTSNLLVLLIGAYYDTNTAITVTDNQTGNTWTQRAFLKDASNIGTAIFTCQPVAATGTFTVTIDPTGGSSNTFISSALYEISGFDTGTPIEAAGASSSGTSASAVADIADTTNDCLKLGVATWFEGAVTGSQGTGWTLGQNYPDNSAQQGMVVVTKSVTGADSTDPTIALSASDQWVASGIAIRGAGGGGGGGFQPAWARNANTILKAA